MLIILASYANRHIENRAREIDGYYNPYTRYTLKDYRSLKSNLLASTSVNSIGKTDFIPEIKQERVLDAFFFKDYLLNMLVDSDYYSIK